MTAYCNRVEMKRIVETSEAVALAAKITRIKVFPMYPITPSTHIPEKIAEYIFNGEMDCQMIDVESEHSALSACVGATAAGARTFTATSSQGLAFMFEILPIASGMRLPIVMAVANRALSAPINIWNDHSDSVSCRDQGWIQLWVESAQEALDTTIQAYKIAENKKVQLPVMVNLDGFTLSHVFEPIEEPEQKKVDDFLPEFSPENILDTSNPKTFGPIAFPDSFMEFKKMQQDAMLESKGIIQKTNSEFKKSFGRSYGNGLVETYKIEDAKFAVLGMGTLCGTARVAIDQLRKKGIKAGLIKIRSLRPWPTKEIEDAAKDLEGIAVIDRHVSLGFEGPLATDIRSTGYCADIQINSYIAGLGGRDITLKHLEKAVMDLKNKKSGSWLK